MMTPHENPRLFAAKVRNAAARKWPEILQALGVNADALTKKNKPCPACGGTDRFSFIDDERGAFVCRSLDREGGDGFELVRHLFGCDFMTAVNKVAETLGVKKGNGDTWQAPPVRLAIAATPAPPELDRTSHLINTWNKATPLKNALLRPAGLYLKGRGLAVPETKALRFAPLLPYWDEGKQLGKWPALLAYVTSPTGELAALMRLYLTQSGKKAEATNAQGEPLPAKKLATVRSGVMRGSAVRLFDIDGQGRIALAEGIETALAVHQTTGLPVWACISAFGLEHVKLPDTAKDVFIFGDNDANQTGQRSAYRLAKRLTANGLNARVFIPNQTGQDWLDVLNENAKAAS